LSLVAGGQKLDTAGEFHQNLTEEGIPFQAGLILLPPLPLVACCMVLPKSRAFSGEDIKDSRSLAAKVAALIDFR
jgi:hypothetical protein